MYLHKFNLVLSVFVFFTLIDCVPIDWHYMTVELKIFICVLLKKQSHLHRARNSGPCAIGPPQNHVFFGGWLEHCVSSANVVGSISREHMY